MGNCLGKGAKHKAGATARRCPEGVKSRGIPEEAPKRNPCAFRSGCPGAGFVAIPEDTPLPNANGYTEGDLKGLHNFSYNLLRDATQKFDPQNFLGQGGFGQVFRGWIDTYTMTAARPGQGLQVAVKKLMKEGIQGPNEWQTELDFLSQYNHPNIVKLMGCCSQANERILVYEYMARGSLEKYLVRENGPALSWSRRINIAIGAAKGLAYLHTAAKPVIHRDLKSANILLDSDFNAKLSDFGLAKFGPQGDITHITTRVVGTRGYFAPEYVATGHVTVMTDVYSFGVVLLEIISGSEAIRRFTDGRVGDLALWAKPYLRNKAELPQVIDRRLRWKAPMEAAYEYAGIVLQCLDRNPKKRPTMAQVVADLGQLELKMSNFHAMKKNKKKRL